MEKRDLPDLGAGAVTWRKSSYSNGAEQCVEVAVVAGGAVALRDSKRAPGPSFRVPPGVWAAFVAAVKSAGADGI